MVSQDVVIARVWPLRMRPVPVIYANLEVAVFTGPDPRLHRAVQPLGRYLEQAVVYRCEGR